MAKTPETMRHVFEVHLHYEIRRLVEMYHLLLKPDEYRAKFKPEIGVTLEDALIVAFCAHARNLLEFFYSPSGADPASVDYANTPYMPLKRKDVKDDLLNKLNNQINHLSYKRTEDAQQRIKANQRKHLVDLICSEAVRLKDHLKPEYDAKYLLIGNLQVAAFTPPSGATDTTTWQGGESVWLIK